jgi:hypothetical protein
MMIQRQIILLERISRRSGTWFADNEQDAACRFSRER